MDQSISLSSFLENQKELSPELASVILSVSAAGIKISHMLNRAGLEDILGLKGVENVQGEEVTKLDDYSNNELINHLKNCPACAALVSEENEDPIELNIDSGRYIVMIDPLDGSSNIDVNISVGTIFGILERSGKNKIQADEFLQKGDQLKASGYILYGTSTMLIYTYGNGVNGFTLDPLDGSFYLSHPDIRTPEDGNIYSINQGYIAGHSEQVKAYIEQCGLKNKSPFSLRYIGSMVADFHRNMLKGGIFIYPSTPEYENGKLRLLYECNPLAFIQEQSGGRAVNGVERILEMQPTSLHQRSPIVIGSAAMVTAFEGTTS